MEETSEEAVKKDHENSWVRKLLDSPLILLLLSLLVVFSSYTVWGVIELFKTPPSNLP